ncbi:MAG: hypothetical protein H6974_12095 [Gammaproteobacteria bacterium]|nr:hypothetical protein [Gammaproteobacteria bacterium]
MTPPKPTAAPRIDTLQPLANPMDAQIPEATPGPSSPTVVSPETDSDPNAPPQVVEKLDTPENDQMEVAAASEETPLEELAPPTPQAKIQQLLIDAQQQMASRRFTAPAGNNALLTYQHVLELESGNPAALEGIERIATYYRDVAEQSLRRGRPDESLAYISRGLSAMPKNLSLLDLRQQARLAQQQRAQAQLEEMRRQQAEQAYAEQQYQEQLHRQSAQEAQTPWWRQPPTNNSNNFGGFNQR